MLSHPLINSILSHGIGELVEKGIMRRLPAGFDGNKCEEIFTWGEERPCKVSVEDSFFTTNTLGHPRNNSF